MSQFSDLMIYFRSTKSKRKSLPTFVSFVSRYFTSQIPQFVTEAYTLCILVYIIKMDDPNAEKVMPEKGKVNRDSHTLKQLLRSGQIRPGTHVRQEWAVHEDGVMAHNLQEQEFGHKYQWNRSDRRTARQDVPLAKFVQTKEEMDLQRQRMELLERNKQIAERDAEIAAKVQETEKLKQKAPVKRVKDDSIIAQQFQQEEMISLERERIRQEIRDEEYARLLQEKEQRHAERKLKQREIAHEKRALEAQQQALAQTVLPGYQQPSADGATRQVSPRDRRPPQNIQGSMAGLSLEAEPKVLRSDGRIEDAGDFSDFYIQPNSAMPAGERRELQELQDEELARLLQDQETKRGAKVNPSALKELEARDAEIARLYQEQEKLKYSRRHKLRAESEGGRGAGGGSRAAPPPPQYGRYQSEPCEPSQPPPPVPSKIYDQQNNYNESMTSGGRVPPPHSNGAGTHGNGTHGNSTHGTPPLSVAARDLPGSYYQGQSPYTSRPLPETPDDVLANTVTVVPVDPRQLSPPSSPPPGYVPPPAYPKRQTDQHQRRSNESSSSGNVIASIDPTFHDPEEAHLAYHLQGHSDGPQGDRPHHAGTHGEDGYCDLDDLGPVQGQRRGNTAPPNLQRNSGDRRDSKKNNCKQQ